MDKSTKRLTVKETIGPGLWIDQDDQLHVSIHDIIDDLGWPHDNEHRSIVERQVHQVIKMHIPGVKFIAVGACPNCGVGDGEKHGVDCELRGG